MFGGDKVIKDEAHHNFEPRAAMFGDGRYSVRASGPSYLLSAHAIRSVIVHSFHGLRAFANEGSASARGSPGAPVGPLLTGMHA
jgi:hypothetical protein